MPEKPPPSPPSSPPPLAEDEYDAICATMMASARGRCFLEEYARRTRCADTAQVLAAIERMEGVMRGERDHEVPQRFRSELLEMAEAIARTRASTISRGEPQLPIGSASADVTPIPEPTAAAMTEPAPMPNSADPAPKPVDPAAPSDADPARAPDPSAAIGMTAAEGTDFLLAPLPPPMISRSRPEPAASPIASAAASTETQAESTAPPDGARGRDAPTPVAELQPVAAPQAPLRDPLAPLRAMSDAERIALFS